MQTKLYDAHCHYGFSAAYPHLVCGTSPADWEKVGGCKRCAFGVHPWFIDSLAADWETILRGYLTRFPRAAVGECGLDGVKRHPKQEEVFLRQLALAEEFRRPIIVHGLKAWPKIYEFLAPRLRKNSAPPTILHGFTSSPEEARRFLALPNVFFSIGFAVLDARAKRPRASAAMIPDERLLAESDGDGSPNAPKLEEIIREIATLRGKSPIEIASLTAKNAKKVFENEI